MKHYILISNTKEYLINKKLLDNISFQIEKFTDRKITFKELSIKQAYECDFFDAEMNAYRIASAPDINLFANFIIESKLYFLYKQDLVMEIFLQI